MVQLLKLYTLEEVAEHDQVDDAWIVIGKNVLDVTSFLMEHPGGDVILDYCGTDATEVFNDADHSPFAVGKFKEYKIGELAEKSQKEPEVEGEEKPKPEADKLLELNAKKLL